MNPTMNTHRERWIDAVDAIRTGGLDAKCATLERMAADPDAIGEGLQLTHEQAEALHELRESMRRGDIDQVPCRQCGAAVACLPEGIQPVCVDCEREADHHDPPTEPTCATPAICCHCRQPIPEDRSACPACGKE